MSVSSTSKSKRDIARHKKSVTFHPSTVLGDSDHIALTITRHSYIYDKGYTQYFIKLMCRGVEWTLHKRYRDFYELHHELIKENQIYTIELPKLPEKRWFERQRWINRADEKYGWIRRIQLQDYLRAIVKLRVLRNESLSFWKFICMPKRVMIGPETAADVDRDIRRSVSSEPSAAAVRTVSPVAATPEKRPSLTLNPIDFLFPKATVPSEVTGGEGTSAEAGGAAEATVSEEYDPEKDLERFNESLQLVAREAVLRGLYGPKSPRPADIDNVANVRKSSDHPVQKLSGAATADSSVLCTPSKTSATSSSSGSSSSSTLKLSKVFDDNGDEVTADSPKQSHRDLSYLASSNALLNARLTSKEEFIGTIGSSGSGSAGVVGTPSSSASNGGSGTVNSSGIGNSMFGGAIRAPPIQLVQANQALWTQAELDNALQAINSESFDTAVHFSGPRSGPVSSYSTPNASVDGAVDLNRNDLNIMPTAPRRTPPQNASAVRKTVLGDGEAHATAVVTPPVAPGIAAHDTPSS